MKCLCLLAKEGKELIALERLIGEKLQSTQKMRWRAEKTLEEGAQLMCEFG